MLAPPLTRGAVEAVLLVADEPVAPATLAGIFEASQDAVVALLHELADEHAARDAGIDLRASEAGWRLHTRPAHVDAVERFLREGQRVRLTRAGLEALAVVAYAQPTTRAHVSSVRGVASDGVLRTLVARGLIEEAGSNTASAATYRTSPLFLERLGIAALSELPPLAPLLPDLPEVTLNGTGGTLNGTGVRPNRTGSTDRAPDADRAGTMGPDEY